MSALLTVTPLHAAPVAAIPRGARIVLAARGYLGVPWRHLGRSRTGVDCIGLVLAALAAAGVPVKDPVPYDRAPQGPRLLEGILAHADRVAVAEPGDVLLFKTGLYGGHVGIATDHPAYRVPAVLHAYAARRKVVEERLDYDLRDWLIGAFRPRAGG